MTRRAELISIEEARRRVLAAAEAGGGALEDVPLRDAQGRVLGASLSATASVPGFDNSAMDGFAVRAGDTDGAEATMPITLEIVDESRAGHPAAASVGAEQAIAISTGAMIPNGADAVVMVERTEKGDGPNQVRVLAEVEPGTNLRRAGEDIRAGSEVLSPGLRLGPAELGVAAAVGAASLPCRPRPRVAVIATGDELRAPGVELGPGQIHDSNAYAVPALAVEAGADMASTTTAADTREATETALASAISGADVVCVCGGVSVGEHDHVKPSLEALGVQELFWGVALRPGKPTWFGVAGEGEGSTLVFGLPGNPVSAMVTFILFVRPALAALQGADPSVARVVARLGAPYAKQPGRAHAIRCRLTLDPGGLVATPAPAQGSHVMTSMLGADCLAMIPAEVADQAPGDLVEVELLGAPRLSPVADPN